MAPPLPARIPCGFKGSHHRKLCGNASATIYPPSWDRRGKRAEERGEWGGTKYRERSEHPYVFA